MEKKTVSPSLLSRYMDLLADEGYRPRVVSEEDDGPTVVHFKAEGEAYLLLVEERDPEFFHLATGYELGEVDLAAAVSRANELNNELKVAKVTIWPPERCVRIHVECFVDEAPAKLGIIERAIGAIQIATRSFFGPARTPDHLDA